LIGWLRSRRAARLFHSRFDAYWSSRVAGLRHEDALRSIGNGETTLPESPGASRSERESLELKALVWTICCKEFGEPPTAKAREKLLSAMEKSFAVVEVRARLGAIGTRA
jgi:hypothetical protein